MAISRLQGSFALGILHEDSPDTLIAVRKGSPLVIGLGAGSHYIASDVPALLGCADRFLFLEDGQMAVLRPDSLEVKDVASGEPRSYAGKTTVIDWTPAMAEKQGYDHFMLKEIHEQPQGVMDTLREWLDDTDRLLQELGIDKSASRLRRLHIAACGTSYHAGLVGRYLIEKFVRIPVAVDIASEFRYMCPIVPKGTLFITITQSGETADTLAAQREAKDKGALAFTICNVVAEGSVRPTLEDATPGDLSFVLPYRHLHNITEMLEALDNVAPGVNSGDTLLYGVEVKFYSMKLKLTPRLETEVKNLFAVGDGAGVTRGLIQASISGVVAAREVLERAGLTTEDVQWIIPHQANYRIIETAARYLKLPLDRFVINVDRYGNTSTASIPIATVEALQKGQIKNGDNVVFVGFGAGLTWGALAAQWTGPLPLERPVHVERYRTWARLRSMLLRVFRFIEGLIWGRNS